MEVDVSGDELAILAQEAAALVEHGVEIVDCLEVTIDDGFVDECPEVLGRLQFWRIGRQIDEPHPVGDGKPRFGVPTGAVEDQDDDALASRADGSCEACEQLLEERLVDAVREIPDGLAAGRLHEGGDVKPLIAMMAERDWPIADGSPDATADWLQAEPVLVRRPYLDRLVRVLVDFFGEDFGELFLKAAASSAFADLGFFGRGCCRDQSSFLSASQPRGAWTWTSPSRAAIQRATFAPVHSPPSSGGRRRRSRNASRSSAANSGLPPALCRRWSPSDATPSRS